MPTTPASGASVFRKFTTRAFATGVATTLSGSPVVSIYKDNSTSQSTAGVTLTVDFDGVAGLNHVTIDTSADGTFYANGSHFELVITTGTVGGSSAIGYVVGDFDLAVADVPQTGDSFARIGSTGSGLTSLSSQASVTALSAYVDTEVAAIKAVTDKLDTALELDGAVYRYTTNALEQGPTGGGGVADWTADERTAIRSILGIPGAGTTPADPSVGILDTIRDSVALRLLTSAYTAPDNTGIDAIEAALTAKLDVAVSTRLASASYTAPDNTGIDAIEAALTAKLDVAVSTRSTYAGGAVASVTSGVALTSAGLDAVTVETGLNARQALAIIAAATAGGSSGVDTGTPATYKGAGVATTRITATGVDGNRTSVTLAPPA